MGNSDFTNRLRRLMAQEGYTQKKLSKEVGITEAAFSRYMNSERIPQAQILSKIANKLNTTSEYLLWGQDEEDFQTVRTIIARSANKITDEQREELISILDTIHKERGQ